MSERYSTTCSTADGDRYIPIHIAGSAAMNSFITATHSGSSFTINPHGDRGARRRHQRRGDRERLVLQSEGWDRIATLS